MYFSLRSRRLHAKPVSQETATTRDDDLRLKAFVSGNLAVATISGPFPPDSRASQVLQVNRFSSCSTERNIHTRCDHEGVRSKRAGSRE